MKAQTHLRALCSAACLAAAAWFWLCASAGLAADAPIITPVEPLHIHTHKADLIFQTELALTPQAQEQGLMYRESLADDAGMLFVMEPPRPTAMWMKNTRISLDMLFIDTQGKIIYIAQETVPESLRMIHAGNTPIRAVLELKGGTSKAQHIEEGNRVESRFFTP